MRPNNQDKLPMMIMFNTFYFGSIAIVSNVECTLISYSAGLEHNCFVNGLGKMQCFGQGNSGELVQGNTNIVGDETDEMGLHLPYSNIGTVLTIKSVACGGKHTCVVLNNNSAKCFGDNSYGQLGTGNTIDYGTSSSTIGDSVASLNLGSTGTLQSFTLGYMHTCALFNNFMVKCFGYNTDGQLGYETTVARGGTSSEMGDFLPFIDFGTNGSVATLHSHSLAHHSCIKFNSEYMKCWGINSFAQLGYNDVSSRGHTSNTMGDNLPVIDFGTDDRVRQIAVGGQHTCVIDYSNQLRCFGRNQSGQLGIGSTTQAKNSGSLTTTVVDTTYYATSVAAGGDFTCITLNDGTTLKCIGGNDYGQLGQGDTTARGNSPTNLFSSFQSINYGSGSLSVSSVITGDHHMCIIFSTGTVKCIGYGSNGSVGSESKGNIGDSPSELGDNLPFVNIFSTGTLSPTSDSNAIASQTSIILGITIPLSIVTLACLCCCKKRIKQKLCCCFMERSNKTKQADQKAGRQVAITVNPPSKSSKHEEEFVPEAQVVPSPYITVAEIASLSSSNKSLPTSGSVNESSKQIPASYSTPSTNGAKSGPLTRVQKKYLAFLSHAKADTGPVATLIVKESEEILKRKKIKHLDMFIDNEHLTDLRGLSEKVRESKVMVAMLSKSYLARPWCLIELHYALVYQIPIIAVNVIGAGYNFEDARSFLENLSEDTLNEVNKGASKEFDKLGIDIVQLGQKLSEELPNIIASEYNPNTSARVREAQLEEIFDHIIKNSKKQT